MQKRVGQMGSGQMGSGGGGEGGRGVVLALQNEFTEIFIYSLFEGFCWEGDKFYANISATFLCTAFRSSSSVRILQVVW